MIFLFITLLYSCFIVNSTKYYVRILSNDNWTVRNKNGSINVKNVTVPEYIHNQLFSKGIITDPIFRFNEVKQRWICEEEWIYTSIFNVEVSEKREKMMLTFKGLDTICRIWLNNMLIGKTENMFIEFVFDVTKIINFGENNLTIRFLSAPNYAVKKEKEYPYAIPRLTYTTPGQTCPQWRNFLRKTPSSFGWDFSPPFPSSGIWKDICLLGFNDFYFHQVLVNVFYVEDSKLYDLKIVLLVNSTRVSSNIPFSVKIEELRLEKNGTLNLVPEENQIVFEFKNIFLTKDQLWWPNGIGEPKLYCLEASILDVTLEKRIGFRNIKVIRKKFNKGTTFYFEVNGEEIFAKGTNILPILFHVDSNATKISNRKKYEWYLESSVESYYNMYRIWGGGYYPDDEFLDLCDQKGILVWLELPFACALYPINSAFLNSVENELKFQLRRLKHHPSLCMIGGNSESEASLHDVYGTTWYQDIIVNLKTKQMYISDYARLFLQLIPQTIYKEIPNIFYFHSSPSSGSYYDEKDQIMCPKWNYPYDAHNGIVHFYDLHENIYTKVSSFSYGRFYAEYGFTSLPSFRTIEKFSVKSDWSYDSDLMKNRFHSKLGRKFVLKQIDFSFQKPNLKDKIAKFKATIYITQLLHCLFVKTETEYFMTLTTSMYTRGTLNWMLNDVWPTESESSIDFYGRWKFVHYCLKESFNNLLITSYEMKSLIKIFIVNHYNNPKVLDVKVNLVMLSWSQNRELYREKINQKINSMSSKLIYEKRVDEFLYDFGCKSKDSKEDCYLYLEIESPSIGKKTSNFHHFSDFKDVKKFQNSSKVNITGIEKIGNNSIKMKVSSNVSVPYLWLDTSLIGKFSENGFFLFPEVREREIYFHCYSSDDCNVEDFKKSLGKITIADTYKGYDVRLIVVIVVTVLFFCLLVIILSSALCLQIPFFLKRKYPK